MLVRVHASPAAADRDSFEDPARDAKALARELEKQAVFTRKRH
jgi:hypothetical protein